MLTITFNPALDVSGTVTNLVPNEKSYVSGERRTPGGNGINAGIIAARLGTRVSLTGFLGGAHGEEIARLLRKEKIPENFVWIKANTRMNITISNLHDHHQTRLSFPGPRVSRTEWEKLLRLAGLVKAGEVVLLGGSLPDGVTPQLVNMLLTKLHNQGAVVFADMPGRILKELDLKKISFIKPNLTEFQELTGKKVKSLPAVLKTARKLLAQVPMICVSSVEGGALLLTQTQAFFGTIPRVKIRSTVGAGDSMVGAIASVMESEPNAPVEKLLRLGLAASCATLTEQGLTLGAKKQILRFHKLIACRALG